ncbi:MAG: cellulase, partial [Pleurocapsa sp. SU_5_0]|nr:cellulase [Pleurocapsa sp. SU_5_0]NJR48140.1 cellulase [Hyellaceae cyanobacterium CSU_1_1]
MANSNKIFITDSLITEDWDGGYKLELDLSAKSDANDWQLDFNLPYSIQAAYGVDLIDNGNGNYSINGQNDQVNLASGQSIKPILIIDDGGQEALKLEFDSVDMVTPEPEPMNPPASTPSTPVTIPDASGQPVGQQGKFAYGEALQKNFLFFEANRSGALPKDNRLEWRA